MPRFRVAFLCSLLAFSSSSVLAQHEGEVIINEIGIGGRNKNFYQGNDYVELLVVNPRGVRLGGWFLTDFSSLNDEKDQQEGAIEFSDEPGSIFQELIPAGTYILVCLGDRTGVYGDSVQTENVSLEHGNNRLVVFADGLSPHLIPTAGTLDLETGDNLAILSSWRQDAAVDMVVWGGKSGWVGAKTTFLEEETVHEGAIAYFVPREMTIRGFEDNTLADQWLTTFDGHESTPGRVNAQVDDSSLLNARKENSPQ